MNRIWSRVKKAAAALAFFILQHGELGKNRRFRGKHQGKRCFILCNGPSVLKQDLLPLRKEIVMSVSSGYLHKDFERINPCYHFVPPVTYGMMTERDYVQWFSEMDDRLGNAELFLGSTEYQLVKRHALFRNRNVSYLCSARPFWAHETGIIDICGRVPVIGSAPIMCLIVAIYMGFREIYLIGTDHDSLVQGKYTYAFEPTIVKGKDYSIDEKGAVRIPVYEELRAYLLIWTQYRHLKRIAEANRVKIFNATEGGMLDEFPRVRLAELLGRQQTQAGEGGSPSSGVFSEEGS
jgi:hypothetical protein